ncbi:GPI transamidase component GAB1 [Spathaspora sp. JA1]|nr:GPI transamidase component GAB1 [Spathaspora sp. JA1]
MQKLTQVFVIGGLIRFLIPSLVPSVTQVLGSTVELSTPINSYKSLQEAFYYLQQGIGLYDGGVNHHPPLLVIILSLFQTLPFKEIIFNLIYTLADLFIAWKLIQINRWYNFYSSKRYNLKNERFSDDIIASFYLFNPLIVLTNLAHSTIIFTWVFIIESIYQVIFTQNVPRSMISLGIASYLSFNPIFLLPPIIAFAHTMTPTDIHKVYIQGFAIFFATIGLLIMSSYVCTSSWDFLDQCYLTIILLKKITPNVGLWWYIFTEMFEFFTPFYLGLFNIYSFVYVLPITIRLFQFRSNKKLGDSFLAIILVYIWLSFTKSYPTIGDLGFGLSILPIFKITIFPYCKYNYIIGLTLIISLLLFPIFYYCWIVLGNGNSNFFYSISLIWGVVHILLLMDLLWGKLIYDYGLENNIEEKNISKLNLAQI